ISNQKEGVVFLLWGGFAKKKAKLIDAKKHHILESGHPSPLSANRGYWFGNKHFSKTNELLVSLKKTPINW
ncbi:MAG: uracil-DNA glycosylase, partial [Polaribacter sp.]